MASAISSIANHDDFSEGDAQSDLQSLTKLYGLLDSSKDINTPGTGERILDEKSRVLLRKMLDESTQQVLKRQTKIIPIPPFENKSPLKILAPKKEYIQHGLNPKKINYSPVPSFLRRYSMKSRQSQPVDQVCVGNRAARRSIIAPHRPIIKSNYPLSGNYKRTNYNKIKGVYNKIRPDFEEDNMKGKSKEVFSDSETGSCSDSYSSTSCDSVPNKTFAKRPEGFEEFAKRPSTSQYSKTPIKEPNNITHNNKTLTKMPTRNINKTHNDKSLIKMASHNNKALIKMASHNKEAGKPKNPKDSTKNKDKKISEEKNRKKESGFKRIKNKLSVIFHHHHHHHLHHGDNSSNKNNNKNNKNIKKHHRSAWKFLKGMVHKPSERAVEIVPHQHHQHKHLSELFHVLASHIWSNNKRKKKEQLLRGLNKNNRRELHWWQKFKKRDGVKLTNGKKTRFRLGFKKGSIKKRGKH